MQHPQVVKWHRIWHTSSGGGLESKYQDWFQNMNALLRYWSQSDCQMNFGSKVGYDRQMALKIKSPNTFCKVWFENHL